MFPQITDCVQHASFAEFNVAMSFHSKENESRKQKLRLVPGLAAVILLLFFSMVCAQTEIPYQASVEGLKDKSLLETIKSVSDTFVMLEHPPSSPGLLKKRAEKDISIINKVFRAKGYYGAHINVNIDTSKSPVQVTFRINPGPQYKLTSVLIEAGDKQPLAEQLLPPPEKIGITVGEPADAAAIIASQRELAANFRRNGFPFVKIDRNVVVDHKSNGVMVDFKVNAGFLSRFGATNVTGLKSVNEGYVIRKIPWKKGQTYSSGLVQELQNKLTQTGLFSLIQIRHADKPDKEGFLPVNIHLEERKEKSVSAGLSYNTDTGVGGQFSWENRNIFHEGQRLRFGISASRLALGGEASYREPEFLRDDQSLTVSSRLVQETTPAYDSRILENAVVLERKLSQEMILGAGPGLRWSHEDQLGITNNYLLLSVPAYFRWDTTDILLDPSKGGRLNLQLTPYTNILGTSVSFLKSYLGYSRYLEILPHPRIIFAARANAGSITGISRDQVPPSIRFYAGGGGSIRGYPFQTVGPLQGTTPLGGRSLVEFSGEFRFRVTEKIGIVSFLDGGSAFESAYPDFSQKLLWGTGLGFRYLTPVGPVRLDVAVPLNKRPDIDKSIQFYIGLGQAF